MPRRVPSLLTVGEIARQLQVSIHRVKYGLLAYRIDPKFRAGNTRVFTPFAVAVLAWRLGVRKATSTAESNKTSRLATSATAASQEGRR